MNFLALCQRLAREVGETGGGPTAVTGQTGRNQLLVDWIKTAWMEIQSKHDWGFLWTQGNFATVAGTSAYTPETDCRNVDTDRVYVDGSDMNYVPFEYARERMTQTNTGKPVEFTTLPNIQMRLFPIPDAIYTISYDYYTIPIELAANTDTPAILSHLHMVIVHKAAMSYAAYFEEANLYEKHKADYRKFMTEMTRLYLPDIGIGSMVE